MTKTAKSFLERLQAIPSADVRRSYKMGRDYALNGANSTNCHFSLFQTDECTAAWEGGKEDAECSRQSS